MYKYHCGKVARQVIVGRSIDIEPELDIINRLVGLILLNPYLIHPGEPIDNIALGKWYRIAHGRLSLIKMGRALDGNFVQHGRVSPDPRLEIKYGKNGVIESHGSGL